MTDHKPPTRYKIPQAVMGYMSPDKTYPLSQFEVTEPLEEIAKHLEIANLIGYATLLPASSPARVQLIERIEEGLRP